MFAPSWSGRSSMLIDTVPQRPSINRHCTISSPRRELIRSTRGQRPFADGVSRRRGATQKQSLRHGVRSSSIRRHSLGVGLSCGRWARGEMSKRGGGRPGVQMSRRGSRILAEVRVASRLGNRDARADLCETRNVHADVRRGQNMCDRSIGGRLEGRGICMWHGRALYLAFPTVSRGVDAS